LIEWKFSSSHNGQVLGLFDLRRFIAWHDDSISGADAFGTLIHEDTHARAIAGSFLHLRLLAERYSALAGKRDLGKSVDPQYWDFVAFHEAQPKAYDIISGHKTSHYADAATMARAEALATLAQDIECKAALVGLRHDDLVVMILRAIALAISDHSMDGTVVSAADLLSLLATVISTSSARELFPNDFDMASPLTEQLREALVAILSIKLGRDIVFCTLARRIVELFGIFAHLLSIEDGASIRGFRDLFIPAMNLLFSGAFVPHAAIRPDRRMAQIATSDFIIRQVLIRTPGGQELYDKKSNQLMDIHRRKMYSDRFGYVYDGFMSKHIHEFNWIDNGLVLPYFNSVFGAFPATVIALFDQVIDPSTYTASAKGRSELFALMRERDESWDGMVEDYQSIRRAIWGRLSDAAIDLPLCLIVDIYNLVQESSSNGSLSFDPTNEPIDFYFGTERFVRIVPG
jgi:hypothetical protein